LHPAAQKKKLSPSNVVLCGEVSGFTDMPQTGSTKVFSSVVMILALARSLAHAGNATCRQNATRLPYDSMDADLTRQLAHEIQAPLTSLELQLRKLTEEQPGSELATSCLAEIESLKRLVASFLELGASGSRERPSSALELAPVFHLVEKRFRPIAAQRNVKLQIECGSVSALCDRGAAERIVSNLVDNAIKFSRDGGTVEISARAHNGSIEVEVRDEGIGIATEARARIFEPFYRVHREIAGFGLGLAISKRLAEAQRGSLQCKSDLDRGASFILTLPAT
jgi:signal transduction histidine kinase